MNFRAAAISLLPLAWLSDGPAPPKVEAPIPARPGGESRAYRDAYALGRDQARIALKDGRATVLTYGLRMTSNLLDEETGLPYETIAGCIVNDSIVGRAAGNYDAIREFIAKNGPPANSMKPWMKDLDDLAAFVKARREAEPVVRLTPGDRGSKSPDGKYTARIVPTAQKGPDGQAFRGVDLILGVGGKELATRPYLSIDDRAPGLVWGPTNSGFLVLSERSGSEEIYWAIDARTGRTLSTGSAPLPVRPDA